MPQELFQELIDRLAQVRAKRERVDLMEGLAWATSGVVILAIIGIALEAEFHLSITGRTILFWSMLASAIGQSAYFLSAPVATKLGLRPRLTDEELSRRIGDHFPALSDRLLNGLQLVRPLFQQSSVRTGSPMFALAAFNRTYEASRPLDFTVIVEDRPLKRALLFLLTAVIVSLGVFIGFHSDLSEAAGRLVHFRTFYQKPAPFVLHVLPENARLMRGDSLHVTITTDGEQLRQLTLHLKEEGEKEFDTITLSSEQLRDPSTPKSIRRAFSYVLRVQHPLEYYAEARGIESAHYQVAVLDHPIVRKLSVTVTPPSYTREKPQTLNENFGDIAGVTGTRGGFTIEASKPLLSAAIIFTPQKTIDTGSTKTAAPQPEIHPLQVSDTVARGSVAFMRSGSYHIAMLDRDSIPSEFPIEYNVSITKDEVPTIALIEPNDRADLPSNLRLNMLVRIHDDFGFRGVRLAYRLTKSKYLPPEKEYKWLDVPLANYNTQDLDVPYIWNLTSLELAPEDEVTYFLEVADNDVISGPKKARTAEFVVRYPSVKEIFERANEQANSAEKNLSDIKQDANELKKKLDEAVNELRQSKSANMANPQQEFANKKNAEQIIQRQEELNKRLEDVAKNLDQMTQQLQQQQALSPETMKEYQDLQKLFQQINSPELKKAMKDLQHAMDQLDPKKVQEAMKNMQFNEDNFKKSIERTTNILKKIQLEQKVDELQKREGELANQEDRASDEQQQAARNSQNQTPQDKAQAERQQQDAKNELERLQQEAKDLAAKMQQLPEKMQAPEAMKAAQDAINDPSNESSMDDASKAAKQGDHSRSSERAKDASAKLKKAQNKMRELKQKLTENARQRDLKELRQIRDELNRLSKSEESIKHQTQQAQPNSNVFRDLADQQSQKKDELGQTASRAMEMSQHSTAITPQTGHEMGEAMANMQNAEDAMTERDQNGAQLGSQGAMASLNRAAQQIQSAVDAMESQGQSGGSGQGDGGEGQGDSPGDNPGESGQQGQGGSAMQSFLSAIQKMTAQQQALNNMMSGMQGSGSSQEKQMMQQQAQLSKLAAQQQAVQKSMQQLADEQRAAQTGDKKTAANLQQLSDQMQEVISEMKTSGVRPETIQRQERILSKLLEAQQSVHQRDKEQTRESKPGENTVRDSPRELDLTTPEGRQELQDELNKAKESGYSKDYDALIRKYFEALQKAGQPPAR